MLKYRIYVTYGGSIYDAFRNDVISEDENFDSLEDATEALCAMHGLNKDLTYIILPVVVFVDLTE